MFNITIPRRSWSFEVKKVKEDTKQQYSMTFTRARMLPVDNDFTRAGTYIGWWSDDVKDRFKLDQVGFKLLADIEDRYPEASQLLEEFDNLKEKDIQGLRTLYRLADVSFSYPLRSRQETIKFNGKFLFSGAVGVFRFQKDFILFSSYNNLQLTSHSVYRSEKEEQFRELAHNSYFTHTTSDTQAFYNMAFKQEIEKNGCHMIYFNHNITSHVFNMASSVKYFCHSSDPSLHTTVLNWDSHSQFWQVLDVKIRQILKSTAPGLAYESTNFTNPNTFINVQAEWIGKELKKTFIINQVGVDHPVMKITIHSTWPRSLVFNLVLSGEEKESRVLYHREISHDGKKLQAYLNYPDNSHHVLRIHGNILNPEHRVWKLNLYPELSHFTKLISNSINAAFTYLETIAEDEFHPLNKMLEPALKMPLSQYLHELGDDIKIAAHQSFDNVMEIFFSLQPFYDSTLTVLFNVYEVIAIQLRAVYSIIEQKSIGIWAVKYFEIPQLLKEMYKNFPSPLSLFKHWLFTNEEKETPENHPIKSLTFHTGKLINWERFDEIPRINFDYIEQLLPNVISNNVEKIQPFRKPDSESKLAMVLGPRHVFTFDGQLYEFPSYPVENCMFLLTHDVYSSKFSVAIDAEYIHLLFPEVALSINSKDEVYVDSNSLAIALPFQTANRTVSVRREGNVLLVTSPSLTVLCEGQNFLCILELSGWNGGGTIGLLGNADGETYNEFMLPNGQIASDVTEFAKSYELSGKSKCRNLKVVDKAKFTKQHEALCSTSLSKVCNFYHHLKSSFLDSCLTYLSEENNFCYTEAALAALCYHKQQPIQTECNVQKQEKHKARHKLEVVLIVNEHQNMVKSKDMRKGIESLINGIQEQFSSHGYSTIRFSLIGFGGDGVRYYPSIHTVGGNIWYSQKDAVSSLLTSLKFDGSEKIDPVVAIKYAAEVLGSDTFDTKVFIAVANEDEQISSKSALELVRGHLDKNHITLYTIASYQSIEKGKKVFGVRADGLIFPSAKRAGDYMEYPRGDLAKLTSATRGSLFLKKFLDSNEPDSYFSEFTKEIWAKVRKEVDYCRSCKNVRSGWWYFQNECSLVNCEAK